jgi:capsular exopolysaccharide synthesis family protein
MSRIHEALQKAYRERMTLPASKTNGFHQPTIGSALEEPPLVKPEFGLQNIARHPWTPAIPSLPTLTDRGVGVEQFRSLRSHIYQAHYETPLKTILVASGMPSEGKSFVAANLAISLARNGVNNILLIDGDMRRPMLHNLLGAPDSPGLSDYLEGIVDVMDVMQRDCSPEASEGDSVGSVSNLAFIPSGKSRDNSSELVASHRIEELIAAVSPHFDWILIDSPPALAVSDAVDLARAADAVLLIARGASTPYDVARRTQAAFSKSRILGFVLNDVKNAPHKGSYTYNYYYNSASEGDGQPGKKTDKRK